MSNVTHKKKWMTNLLTREEYLRNLAESNTPLNICLTNDYSFRKTFKNKTVAKGFVMALLNLSEDEIEDLEVIDPFEEGECDEEKEGVLDVKLKLKCGKRVNIEMQSRMQDDWPERSLFYNCRMFIENFTHGTPYRELSPCLHVGILDFNIMKSPNFHHEITLRDTKNDELYSGKFAFHVVELKKLDNVPESEKNMPLYRWAKLISAKNWKEVCEVSRGDSFMEAARDVMDKINQDKTERYLYLRREMAYIDEQSRIRTAENFGIKQGLEQGKIHSKKEDILALLSDLGDIPPNLTTYIDNQSDLELLKSWVKKAAKAVSIEDFQKEIIQ